MIEFETSIQVQRPLTDVFAYLGNPENETEWSSAVLESRLDAGGPVAEGSHFTQVLKFLGRRMENRVEVTDYQPDRRIAYRVLSGPMQIAYSYTVSTDGDGTRISARGEGEPGGFIQLAAPVIGRAMKRQADSDLNTLKDLLEARVTTVS